MKILQVLPTYKPAYVYGGTVFCVSLMCESYVKAGHEVLMLTTTANGKEELDVPPGQVQSVDGVPVIYFNRWTKDHSQFSPGLLMSLWKNCKKYDVVHIHSWWNLSVIFSVLICWLRGVKPILSPHGMLSDFSFNKNHGFLKGNFHKYIGSFLLRQTKLHLTSEAEQVQLGSINDNNFVLPNFIEMSPVQTTTKKENEIFTMVFLSRIHPKKNIEGLIEAMSKVDFDVRLQLIGGGEEEYIETLKRKAAENKVGDKIEWLGELLGDIKFKYLAEADLFVLPSHNENFALVVTEALSAGTPVLISKYVGLAKYVATNDLGWICDIDSENVADVLTEAHGDLGKRKAISARAPKVVQGDFSPEALTKKYMTYYEGKQSVEKVESAKLMV